ncbi:MAG TPA: hydrogenase maturation nickel metallochaperone HypA [Candidatus Sumerlaeota bacterium]|jgi:Zn finger protein HypA/HybF involved in hydrogenase expression|nr:MAG: hydrogenase nickel incorporation protein [candidate division BRC1 bacterium ADurb.Bin183]HOE62780.1 hydrogenase maturation nickel metallochaperone HypA [Candidatus Sumerlaeota bacterium]HRR29691.1 hydrogenase maturation nickel metallochaperone HypA [Candidatus Sumerlaeia bacterium]HON50360.1 hydrogenase maturation nickel metallochaperone HypA [Candidatus Sumerlaeota bacterium]HOR63576.1 hydrogenase maturation nickel metallochaperone HypA [Candidatus Sumerlaeota bacterium]
MHEMRLLRDLMEDLLKHAEKLKVKKVTAVYIRIGELTEINGEILRHYFTEHSKGTVAEGAEIILKPSPLRELVLESIDCE